MNLYVIFNGTECRWDSKTIAIISAESQEQATELANRQRLFGEVMLLEPGTEAKVDYSYEQTGADSNPGLDYYD